MNGDDGGIPRGSMANTAPAVLVQTGGQQLLKAKALRSTRGAAKIIINNDWAAKRLGLLRELIPAAEAVAIQNNPARVRANADTLTRQRVRFASG